MTSPADTAKKTAHKARSSTAVRVLARAGYAALGLVHVLLGILVLVVAAGGDSESDQSGAFKAIAEAPMGFAVLWVLAIGLWALALWLVVNGIITHESSTAKKWGSRLKSWGRAVIYGSLGGIAASVALGARPNGDQSTESKSAMLLDMPGGVFILGAVAIGVAATGVAFIVNGVMRRFQKKLSTPTGSVRTVVTFSGVLGYIAKGVALFIVGALLMTAAVQHDPSEAGGTDEAVSTLIGMPFGPILVGAVGIGLLAYGVFCFFRARYARLEES